MDINECGYYEVGILTGYSLKHLIAGIEFQLDFSEDRSDADIEELKYTLGQLKEATEV